MKEKYKIQLDFMGPADGNFSSSRDSAWNMFNDFLIANDIEMVLEKPPANAYYATFYGTKEALEQMIWDFFNPGSWHEDYPIDHSNEDFLEIASLIEGPLRFSPKLTEAKYYIYSQNRNSYADTYYHGAPIWNKNKRVVKTFYAESDEEAKEFLKSERKKIPREEKGHTRYRYTLGSADKASAKDSDSARRQDAIDKIDEKWDEEEKVWLRAIMRDYSDIPTDHLISLVNFPPELTTKSDEYISASVGASVTGYTVYGGKTIDGVTYSATAHLEPSVHRV